jgi:hypothetical protein
MASDSDRIAAAALAVIQQSDTWTGVVPLCAKVLTHLGRKRQSQALIEQVYEELDDLAAEGLLLIRTGADDLPEYIVRERFFNGKRFLVRLTPF